MPKETNKGEFWTHSPNMAAFMFLLLIMVVNLVWSFIRNSDLQAQISSIRNDSNAERIKLDERDRATVYRDAQIVNMLLENSRQNVKITTQLERISNDMVISGGGTPK